MNAPAHTPDNHGKYILAVNSLHERIMSGETVSHSSGFTGWQRLLGRVSKCNQYLEAGSALLKARTPEEKISACEKFQDLASRKSIELAEQILEEYSDESARNAKEV